jgi:sugar phosphate isomerase/epimerase
MTLEDFIQKAVELRVDAVDMMVYYLKSTDPEYLDHLRYLAYKSALPFSGAACNASMVQVDAAGRAECVSQIKKWVDVTDRLGASHLMSPRVTTRVENCSWLNRGRLAQTMCERHHDGSLGLIQSLHYPLGTPPIANPKNESSPVLVLRLSGADSPTHARE